MTKLFNFYLNEKCMAIPVDTISIFDELVDRDGLTNMHYYLDMVHLSQKAMPLALSKFREWRPEQKFKMTIYNKVIRTLTNEKLRLERFKSRIVNTLGHRLSEILIRE